MAYYSYYQNSQPTWGTQQYQYIDPPMPQYQPQPSWHGADYYRAHSNSQDNTLFNSVWSRVKSLVSGAGVGRKEATHWWKRIYGGFVDPSKLLPRDIGAAAGYEAIRCWEHHKSIYVQPLSDNREREREALIGLAIAEASKLWYYTQRPLDTSGRREASEVAAATASHIFSHSYDHVSPYDAYETRGRRRSISGTRYGRRSGFSDDEYYDDDDGMLDDSYGTDYLDAYPSRSRRRQRSIGPSRRSSSLYRRSPSPVAFGRRSPSPMMGLGTSPSVGLSTSVASNYPTQYSSSATGLGQGIPGMYYPQATAGAYYPQSTGGYSYQQLPGTSPYGHVSPLPYTGVGGASPYMNRAYAGSSVGLPPPPAGQYLAAPGAMGHHRSRSAGSYGNMRPTFGY